MKTNEMILSGATLIIIGMGGWLLTTVNQLENDVQLLTHKANETQEDIDVMQAGLYLTDPDHNSRTCPICLHQEVGYR
jgi:hypothetical protein|tara:strand:+ start:823 stop:1056 length:234 start_codon:yes stop_codon:yes gene_type:complete